MSTSSSEHKAKAPRHLHFAVITISTSRSRELQRIGTASDPSGDLISDLLFKAEQTIVHREIIPDDPDLIRHNLERMLNNTIIDVVIMCGGTGITPTDVTIETVYPSLEKVIPGFGEIFRWISYEQVGSAAVLSRAIAGLARGKAIFCLPGSPQAVEMALRHLIIPEVGHIIKHARE